MISPVLFRDFQGLLDEHLSSLLLDVINDISTEIIIN